MITSELISQQLDTLGQRFQALRDQAEKLPEARETLAPALQEVAEAIAAVREVRQPEVTPIRSEDILLYIFEANPDLLNVIDCDFNIVMSNWHGHEFISEAERGGHPKCFRVYRHRDRPCDDCHLLQVIATGQVVKVEKTNPVDGRTREIVTFPIRDESGRVSMVTEHVRDITERKLTEEALLTQALVLEKMAEAVTVVSEDGHIVYANPATYGMFGYPDGELTGQHIMVLNDLPPEENEQFVREVMEQLGNKGTWFGEVRNRTKSGTPFITSARASTLELDGKKLWISVQEDITARKHLEKATEGYLQFIQLLMDTIPNPIFYKDAQGILLGCNRAFAEYAGVSQREIPGKTGYDFLPEEVARVCDEGDQEAMQHPGTTVHLDFQGPADSSSQHQMICQKASFMNSSGSLGGVVSVLTDITDLKRMEEALAIHLQFMRILLDAIPNPIFYKDTQGAYLGCNKAFADMLGVTPEEIVGKTVYDINPKELADKYHRMDLAVFQNPGSQIYESPLLAADGTSHHVVFHKATYDDADGNIAGLVGNIVDISDLKRAEEAVQESEARLRAIFEHAPVGMTMLDPAGRFLQTNPALQAIVGYSAAELRSLKCPQITHPEDLPEQKRLHGELLAGKRQYYSIEKRYIRKDGEVVWVDMMLSRLLNSQGKVRAVGTIIDITARKRAEEALRESEQRFRDTTENAIEWIWEVDVQGRYTYSSPVVEQLLGYKPEEVLGKHYYDFFLPDQRDEPKNASLELLATKQPFRNFLNQNLHKNGQIVWLCSSGIPILDDQRNLLGYRGSDMDITAQKQAEEALRKSEQRFRLMAETIEDVLWMSTPNVYNMVYVSPAYETIWGQSCDRLYQSPQSFLEAIHPEDREQAHYQILANQSQGLPFSQEYRIIRPDGSVRWIHNHGFPVKDDQRRVILYTGVAKDITERKQAEVELRESEQRFRLMAETIQDVFWISDPAIAKTKYVSPRYEQVWGRTRKELYQSAQAFLEAIHPEDRERVRSEIFANHERGEHFNLEFRIIRPDGEVRWIQDRGFPVRDDQGEVILFIGVAKDITERKTLEQQLLLAQKMEAVGRLAGGVAHDFNNLLMAITGYGEIMRAKILREDPLYSYLEDILTATDRAAALTKQLLTFSRQQIVHPQVVDLNRLVMDLKRMLRRLIEEDIELKIITGPSPVMVKADPGYLNQIIMNLVINARDAILCGGQIIVETGEVEFYASRQTRFGVAPPGSYVTLEVSDNGIGMDESIQAHIFEPFFTTKEPGKGTGLGLSIVYGIIKQSGGFIDLESESGLGSTFTIYLPHLEASMESAQAKAPKMTRFRGEETILLVEDEEVLRILLAKFLRLHGYTVLEARHGNEALEICEKHRGPIHMVVTDVVMPQMSGRVLADRLSLLRPEMKVLFMSGYTEDEVVQRGVADLSVAFLQKPFKPIDLARQVRAVLHPPKCH
jgi:two-component system cell cycle sensor histidine kinase/response regulator CckA